MRVPIAAIATALLALLFQEVAEARTRGRGDVGRQLEDGRRRRRRRERNSMRRGSMSGSSEDPVDTPAPTPPTVDDSCETITLTMLGDDIIANSIYEGSDSSSPAVPDRYYFSVPVYDENMVEVGSLQEVLQILPSGGCIGRQAWSLEPTPPDALGFSNYFSQMFTKISCLSPYGVIAGGTGSFTCATGFTTIEYSDGWRENLGRVPGGFASVTLTNCGECAFTPNLPIV